MIIDLSRITLLLKPQGFVVGRRSEIENSFSFVRFDRRPELFQSVTVRCLGKQSDTVVGWVAVAVTRNLLIKGLGEMRVLEEIAREKERGVTVIRNSTEALEWENELSSVGPRRAEDLVSEVGSAILAKTESARAAAAKYVGMLDLTRPIPALIDELRDRFRPSRVRAAVAIAEWPGVLQVRGAQDLYLLSCLSLVGFEEEVEKSEVSFADQGSAGKP